MQAVIHSTSSLTCHQVLYLKYHSNIILKKSSKDLTDLKMGNVNETAFLSATIKEIRILQPQKKIKYVSYQWHRADEQKMFSMSFKIKIMVKETVQ